MREQRGKDEAVLPKLQEESAEQRTYLLACILVVHTSFLFFL